MKKSLEEKIPNAMSRLKKKLGWDCYYSETIPDLRYKNYKYFIKFCNTHTVFRSFKTQKQIEEFCNKLLEENILLDEI